MRFSVLPAGSESTNGRGPYTSRGTCVNFAGDVSHFGGEVLLSKMPFPMPTQKAEREHQYTLRRTNPALRWAAGVLTSSQREVHLHLRLNFDRLAVQQIRFVFPLLHSFDRGRSQHRVPADQLQVFDVPCLADLRLQNHCALNTRLTRQRRVCRRNLADQKTRGYTSRHAHTLRCGNFRNSDRGRTQNASDHSAHRSTRDTARNAANYTSRSHDRRWRLFFLNHLYFLWNLGGRAQLTIDDIGLNDFHDLHRCCGRWWRRWRWRGGHQESQSYCLWQGFG